MRRMLVDRKFSGVLARKLMTEAPTLNARGWWWRVGGGVTVWVLTGFPNPGEGAEFIRETDCKSRGCVPVEV